MQNTITDWGFRLLILSLCISLLPQSPFNAYIGYVDAIPYLSYLNWFIPIDGILLVMQAWLQVVLIYCGYMVALRYSHALKGG